MNEEYRIKNEEYQIKKIEDTNNGVYVLPSSNEPIYLPDESKPEPQVKKDINKEIKTEMQRTKYRFFRRTDDDFLAIYKALEKAGSKLLTDCVGRQEIHEVPKNYVDEIIKKAGDDIYVLSEEIDGRKIFFDLRPGKERLKKIEIIYNTLKDGSGDVDFESFKNLIDEKKYDTIAYIFAHLPEPMEKYNEVADILAHLPLENMKIVKPADSPVFGKAEIAKYIAKLAKLLEPLEFIKITTKNSEIERIETPKGDIYINFDGNPIIVSQGPEFSVTLPIRADENSKRKIQKYKNENRDKIKPEKLKELKGIITERGDEIILSRVFKVASDINEYGIDISDVSPDTALSLYLLAGNPEYAPALYFVLKNFDVLNKQTSVCENNILENPFSCWKIANLCNSIKAEKIDRAIHYVVNLLDLLKVYEFDEIESTKLSRRFDIFKRSLINDIEAVEFFNKMHKTKDNGNTALRKLNELKDNTAAKRIGFATKIIGENYYQLSPKIVKHIVDNLPEGVELTPEKALMLYTIAGIDLGLGKNLTRKVAAKLGDKYDNSICELLNPDIEKRLEEYQSGNANSANLLADDIDFDLQNYDQVLEQNLKTEAAAKRIISLKKEILKDAKERPTSWLGKLWHKVTYNELKDPRFTEGNPLSVYFSKADSKNQTLLLAGALEVLKENAHHYYKDEIRAIFKKIDENEGEINISLFSISD